MIVKSWATLGEAELQQRCKRMVRIRFRSWKIGTQRQQVHTNLFQSRKLKCIVPRHFSPAFRVSGKTYRRRGKIPGRSGIKTTAKLTTATHWSVTANRPDISECFSFIRHTWRRHVTCSVEKAGFKPRTLGTKRSAMTTALHARLKSVKVSWCKPFYSKWIELKA